MKLRLTMIVALFPLICSCVSNRPTATSVDESIHRAMLYLVSCQNPDGSWGNGSNRVILTSLATLAFLSHGRDLLASEDQGETERKALECLVKMATDQKKNESLTGQEHVLLAWSLAEAYRFTLVPQLREPAVRQTSDCMESEPTPWHVLAAPFVRWSGIDARTSSSMNAYLVGNFPTNASGKAYEASRLLLPRETQGWDNRESDATFLRILLPEKWAEDENALLLSLLLSRLTSAHGGEEWRRWNHFFYPSLPRSQVRHGNTGSWTPQSLGIHNSRETMGMSGQEATIFTTSVIVLTFPPRRYLPVYEKSIDVHGLEGAIDQQSKPNTGIRLDSGIRIDVQGL